jgi:HPt (histidine-containing phosphotransfer) domain-containing protein
MDLKSCYTAFGGDYEEVLGRLYSEKLVKKFLLKFLEDKSFEAMVQAWKEGNGEEAFRMAHTLKGVCQNLGIARLGASGAKLSDLFRGGTIPPESGAVIAAAAEKYAQTRQAIETYRAETENL